MPSLVRLSAIPFCTVLTRLIVAVMTLCACTPPLDQVLQLWDFLLAFGVHLNVLCVIAQLLLMRDELMMSKRSVQNFLDDIGTDRTIALRSQSNEALANVPALGRTAGDWHRRHAREGHPA